jgi:GMP synthase-like glutamine amidotransferase
MNDVSVMVLVVVDFGCPNTPQIVQVVQNFLKTVQIHVINPESTCIVDFEENLKPVGIILSGGPDSVLSNSFRDMDSEIYDMDVPILGICYGAQLLVYHDDIEKKCLKKNYGAEFGYFEIDSGRTIQATLEQSSEVLFAGMKEKRMRVRMSHWDSIVSAPDGYKVTSRSSGLVSNVSEERDYAAGAGSSGTPRRVYTPCGDTQRPERPSAFGAGVHNPSGTQRSVYSACGGTAASALQPSGGTPAGGVHIPLGTISSLENVARKRYAVQFHPEVGCHGVIENFLRYCIQLSTQ